MTQPTDPTAAEAELWMALHDAMDGNLRVSRRRTLLADYKAAVLNMAAAETAMAASGASLAAEHAPTAPESAASPERPPTGRTAPRRRLTDGEYSAAWHAIEGAAGEEGADPATVLHAVLDRLGIDTPAAVVAPANEETSR